MTDIIARLADQLQSIIEVSGHHPDFDSKAWVERWVSEPLPALGGKRPMDFFDTDDGQEVVTGLLGQVQSAAYA